jgi:hypothetical protein
MERGVDRKEGDILQLRIKSYELIVLLPQPSKLSP